MRTINVLIPLPLLAAALLPAGDFEVPAQTIELEDLQLELSFPGFDDFEVLGSERFEEPYIAGWEAQRGDSFLEMWMISFSAENMTIVEPEDITDRVRGYYTDSPDSNLKLEEKRMVQGDFGVAPYAHLLRFDLYDGTDAVGEVFVVGGLHEEGGYAFEVRCNPTLEGDDRKELIAFLEKGIEYQGKERDPEWSEEEVEARMESDFHPDMLGERLRAHRTKHYIVLGNSSGAKAFGKKLEEYYKIIQKTFGFEEQKDRRLMPIFLWRTRDEYIQFCMHNTGMSAGQANGTAGYAWKDFYTCTYESPADPTHIHELTHQLMKNRLRMIGGGSWYHEGAARYIEAIYNNSVNANMFTVGKKQPKADVGDRLDFKTLISTPTLAFGPNGSAGEAYNTAGTITWFVNKDKRTKDKFLDYMYAMSETDRVGDFEGIERALRKVYNIDLATFEEWYLEFWKKPKK